MLVLSDGMHALWGWGGGRNFHVREIIFTGRESITLTRRYVPMPVAIGAETCNLAS